MASWGREGNLPKGVGLVGASQLPPKAEDDLMYYGVVSKWLP